ncbi:hypothetical protein [Methylorubrum aminovorans]|uniref:hypothetical protein n=1 Tax=Methylorubrum aminovorans TaxID=269069 RepID=UPI003C2B43EC
MKLFDIAARLDAAFRKGSLRNDGSSLGSGAGIVKSLFTRWRRKARSRKAHQDVVDAYDLILGRAPDAIGLREYTSALLDGRLTVLSLVGTLAASPEGQRRRDCSISTEAAGAAVEDAYQLLLGRLADPDGLSTFREQLTSGKSTVMDVVRQILLSQEGQRHRDCSISTEAAGAAVEDAYQLLLGRLADPDGLSTFREQLTSGKSTVMDVVRQILLSQEGQLHVGSLDSESRGIPSRIARDFAIEAYRALLHREIDDSDLNNCVSELVSGRLSAGTLIRNISISQEYQDLRNKSSYVWHGHAMTAETQAANAFLSHAGSATFTGIGRSRMAGLPESVEAGIFKKLLYTIMNESADGGQPGAVSRAAHGRAGING